MSSNTVFITGSSRGIGLALATWFTAAGWKVIGAARTPAKADKLRALNPHKIVQLDTTDEASIQNAAKELEGEEIDLLINNAGICHREDFFTLTRESLVQQFDVNTVGPFLVTRAFYPHVKAAATSKGHAKIAHISSVLGSISLSNGTLTGYSVSKAALNMLHTSITASAKADNISCIVICPGYVSTDMNGEVPGTIKPEKSAEMVGKVLTGYTAADTGKYYSHEGSELAW
ncbi:hypothetical protein Poli38472_011032 [Pythium oligandrum]|uniref:NAD(P)-binding protein n=1 Tax=Pythium oligandrum TaxID=41045 RepID=A0A8K1FPZ5_PYTOL|nr:hypothetical protein Poli38472_011032 [Pythium oligandrum]|eukprot:TMW67412.1 hypothetical protein Poli38472_011032 [Pythium oligandrum]